MILVDLNQVMISNLMQNMRGIEFEPDLLRHMILQSLLSYKKKFGKEYGELIICCDDKNYWRKQIYPYYKKHRKKEREQSGYDWHAIFETLNEMREDLKKYFPYRVLHVETAEADDIIGVLCKKFGYYGIASDEAEKILIMSSDKDFVQLQKYANVTQYSPIHKKFISVANPARFIQEHIIRGDRGDGVPNILSPDDVLTTGERQRPITQKKIDKWNGKAPEEFCDEEMLRNYKRNQAMVDLDCIPEKIENAILEAYENSKRGDRSQIMFYLASRKLRKLLNNVQDF